jgi:hypothetical protein
VIVYFILTSDAFEEVFTRRFSVFRVFVIFDHTHSSSSRLQKKREEKNALLHSSFFFSSARCGHRVSCTLGIRERERERFVLHILSFLSVRGLSKSARIKKNTTTRERERDFLLSER